MENIHYIKPAQAAEPAILRWARKVAYALGGVGLGLMVLTYTPFVVISGRDSANELVSSYIKDTAVDAKHEFMLNETSTSLYQPDYDRNLPSENRLKIPSIGLTTVIQEASIEDHEEALRVGVWRAPDFGTPYDRNKPTIMAAHRFGYLKWTNTYRRENSFYNLPKLEVGDLIEIIWRKRKYTYAVTEVLRGESIDNYATDLILYTCQDLTSDERIFVYAELLEI